MDVEMAMHWIDRYASGVDAECQIDRVSEALGMKEAGTIVRELQSLLLHASVMGMDCTYNGKPMRELISHIVAANSAEQMLAALSPGEQP